MASTQVSTIPSRGTFDCLDERAVPRINPTKLYPTLAKRDTMHFDSSEATIFATPQVIYDVAKYTRMASVTRSEVENLVTTLRLSGFPPARNVPQATPTSSDEDERKDARTVRFLIPPSENVEEAPISSVSTEGKNNHKVEQEVKENERANSPGFAARAYETPGGSTEPQGFCGRRTSLEEMGELDESQEADPRLQIGAKILLVSAPP